jgi:hypothetical protein
MHGSVFLVSCFLAFSFLHTSAHFNGVTLSEAKGLGVAGGRCFASLSMTKGA